MTTAHAAGTGQQHGHTTPAGADMPNRGHGIDLLALHAGGGIKSHYWPERGRPVGWGAGLVFLAVGLAIGLLGGFGWAMQVVGKG